jgi:hypothetical protein
MKKTTSQEQEAFAGTYWQLVQKEFNPRKMHTVDFL